MKTIRKKGLIMDDMKLYEGNVMIHANEWDHGPLAGTT